MQLKSENETLEEKIKLLTKELSFLKDLFLAHAGTVFTLVKSLLQCRQNVCDLVLKKPHPTQFLNLQGLQME